MTNNIISTLDEPKYRAKEAAKLLGIGLSTFWLYVKNGKIPQGIKVSYRLTIWPKSFLEAYWANIQQKTGKNEAKIKSEIQIM
jgi:predicted DNA-binding transcriptional regulator AlpA